MRLSWTTLAGGCWRCTLVKRPPCHCVRVSHGYRGTCGAMGCTCRTLCRTFCRTFCRNQRAEWALKEVLCEVVCVGRLSLRA